MTAPRDKDIHFIAELQSGGQSRNREKSEPAYLLMWSESELVDLLVQRLGKTRDEVLHLLDRIQNQKRKETPCLVTP